jgi:tetratricopeptide (TPR) repeat protein
MPIVPLGIWWFFIALVPTSTLVALKLVLNEQRLYLAAVGIFFIAGAALGRALEWTETEGKHGVRQALICGFAIVLVVLSALTIRRNTQWRSPLSLWSSTLRHHPDSARANTQMANIYLRSGNLNEALSSAQKAVKAAPDVVEAQVALATAYSRLDMQDEALAAARAAVDLNPDSAEAQAVLGLVYARLERYSEAEAAWKRAVEINPQDLDSRENLERLKKILQAGSDMEIK